jgi:hypothetical protein
LEKGEKDLALHRRALEIKKERSPVKVVMKQNEKIIEVL